MNMLLTYKIKKIVAEKGYLEKSMLTKLEQETLASSNPKIKSQNKAKVSLTDADNYYNIGT